MARLANKLLGILLLSSVSLFTQAASWQQTLEADAQSITKLLAFTGNGSTKVKLSSSQKVKALLNVQIPGDMQSAKSHFDDYMQIYLKPNQKKLTLKVGYKKGIPSSKKLAKVDVHILMPKNMYLDLRDLGGTVDISGLRKGLKVTNGEGNILLSNNNGKIIINDRAGDIKISGGKGKLKINDGSGDIKIAHRQGSVAINDKSGDITILDNKGAVRLTDTSGDIALNKVRGFVKVKDGSGKLSIKNVKGNVKFKSKSGLVELVNIDGNVTSQGHGKTTPKLSKISGKQTGI
ncbi:hypothetical protein D5018_01455 [Parashewanella curva]|uniref:DUF4097 domain-containing protein n=1 Tax=Parashewanella curva TaxID=2338552 RepID=A0A3L8Q335_9GAMM|nr:DUF4097 family beta strand repeat-containing protein [Parashewanella curva]RLV61539.1 hypothetical protein D5018_01455 [Parashewanella curva]